MSMSNTVRFARQSQNPFSTELRKRVDNYFKENKISKNANATMVIKTISLFLIFSIPFLTIMIVQPAYWISFILWAIMGFGIAGIGMSVMHDAIHGSYSKKKWVNDLLGASLNLLGGSIFTWKLQHNVLHHTYTNITDLDEDIDDKFIMKFSPHTEVRGVHRFQWIYSFFFYGLLTIYWVVAKDFVQFARYIKKGLNKQTKAQNAVTLTKIILAKVFYFFLMFYVPIGIAGVAFWHVFAGFVLMHFIAGFILTTTFQLAHTVEETDHPLPNLNNEIENDWFIHQLNTTVNFSTKNPFLTWYMGGLNYQVEHHLFPNISHVHYPAIAPIVKATAEEYGVPYLENKTLWNAVDSHIQMLKKLGKLPDMNEALA